ncbi:hypothetical protein LCGC14_1693210 [marine sediment metagenome]|uniref:Uncharacterized protein n=1 Tax=marine sediment metagenome TaxID=412755 RepID=A0A0F9I7P8_9ZZZZ
MGLSSIVSITEDLKVIKTITHNLVEKEVQIQNNTIITVLYRISGYFIVMGISAKIYSMKGIIFH